MSMGRWRWEPRKPPNPSACVGLLKRDYLEHTDLGDAFLPTFWSRGCAPEAAEGVLEHGRRTWVFPKT